MAAFTTDPGGGNPAGVWIGDALPSAPEMQRIAAEVGYSETAFLAPDGSGEPGAYRVRYFSPLAEVPFCGHATIASGVVLAERGLTAHTDDGGRAILETNGGPVSLETRSDPDGRTVATLTSVETSVDPPDAGLVDGVMTLLGWEPADLDPRLPPAVGFAGARHLILAARESRWLDTLDYPFETLKALMLDHDLTTIQLIWRERPDRFIARDPFPVGGVFEDPATGAAAAALGGYLRDRGEIEAPATFEIRQGVAMGRPSLLTVSIETGVPGVLVSGTAIRIAAPS